METHTSTDAPSLLSLRGRIDHTMLEDALAEVQQGVYANWRFVRESRRAGSTGGRHIVAALLAAVFGMFNQPSSAPTRAIVLEHLPTHRETTLTFDYLGEANGLPLWGRG